MYGIYYTHCVGHIFAIVPFVVLGNLMNFFPRKRFAHYYTHRAMLYGHLGRKLLIMALLFHCIVWKLLTKIWHTVTVVYACARCSFGIFVVNECLELRNVLPHQWLEKLLRLLTIRPALHVYKVESIELNPRQRRSTNITMGSSVHTRAPTECVNDLCKDCRGQFNAGLPVNAAVRTHTRNHFPCTRGCA